MTKRKRPVLITLCDKCGGAFHGCIFDELALYDIELLKELTDYAKEGREMKVVQANSYEWCKCEKVT